MPVSSGCFAAPLDDCDGGALTREHYFSEALLEQFGGSFFVSGASWATTPKRVSPKSLASRILCAKHNNGLSELDTTAADLFGLVRAAHEGNNVGSHEFVGEHLERWAIKALVGAIASGTLFGEEGRELVVPLDWLRVMYGHSPVAPGCGMYYVGGKIDGFDADLLNMFVNSFPVGDAEAGRVFGVTIRVGAFQFLTTVSTRLEVEGKQQLYHRPNGFQLGKPERGRIGLTWEGARGPRGLILNMPGDVT